MTTEPEIYPQYCFHLSPTLDHWCHFRAIDIVRLTSHPGFHGQDIYFHLNHPIKWVRVCGLVVAIHELDGRRIYTIDDSSGATIECVLNTPRSFGAQGPTVGTAEWNYKVKEDTTGRKFATVDGPIDVGHVLDIKGNVNVFRDEKQIIPDKIKHLRTTEQEALFWGKAAHLHKHVLDRPWVLDSNVVRKLRREAEGRKLRRRETGLERHGARRTMDNADSEEPSNPTHRHDQTGLEPTAKRRKIDVETQPHITSARPKTGLEPTMAIRKAEERGKPEETRAGHRETGLEPKSKRSEVDAEKKSRTTRPHPLRTGLESTKTQMVDKDGTSNVTRPPHITGLELAMYRERAEVGEKTHDTQYRRRETGLEPTIICPTVGEEERILVTRPHRLQSELESTKPKVIMRDTIDMAYPCQRHHDTGLEAHMENQKLDKEMSHDIKPRASGSEIEYSTKKGKEEMDTQQPVRATGPGKQSGHVMRAAVKTMEYSACLEDHPDEQIAGKGTKAPNTLTVRPRITGLERQPLQRKQEDARFSGLKNQNKRIRTDNKPSAPYHHLTGLEKHGKPSQEKETDYKNKHCRLTGLESQSARKKEQGQLGPEIKSCRGTGLEAQIGKPTADTIEPEWNRHRVTGLERPSGKKTVITHPLEDGEDHDGQDNTDHWNIGGPGKPVLVRGRTRTTGLERRVKAVTRVPPVTDQYDVTY